MSEKLYSSRILQVKLLLESFHITRYFVHAQTVSTKPLFKGERSSFYHRTFLFPPSLSFHNNTIERETFKGENFCKFFFFSYSQNFSTQNWATWCLLVATLASNPRKFSLRKSYFPPIRERLFPQKFPVIWYMEAEVGSIHHVSRHKVDLGGKGPLFSMYALSSKAGFLPVE